MIGYVSIPGGYIPPEVWLVAIPLGIAVMAAVVLPVLFVFIESLLLAGERK